MESESVSGQRPSSIRSGRLSASSSSRGSTRPAGGCRGASEPVAGALWVPDQAHTPCASRPTSA